MEATNIFRFWRRRKRDATYKPQEYRPLLPKQRAIMARLARTGVLVTVLLLSALSWAGDPYFILGTGWSSYHARCVDESPDGGCSGFFYQAGYDREVNMTPKSYRIGFGGTIVERGWFRARWLWEASYRNLGQGSQISGFTSDENFDPGGGCYDPCEKQRWAYLVAQTTGVSGSILAQWWDRAHLGLGYMKYRSKSAVELVDFNMPGYPTRNDLASYDKYYHRGETLIYRAGLRVWRGLFLEFNRYDDISTPVSQIDRADEWMLSYKVLL